MKFPSPRQVSLLLGAALVVWLLALASHALASPPQGPLLALDDVHDCSFTKDGKLVAATSGGLFIEDRAVLTALDGLPDTEVVALSVGAARIDVLTARGSATVNLEDLGVTRTERSSAGLADRPRETLPNGETFAGAWVRKRTRSGDQTCVATSGGLFVARGAEPAARVPMLALPSGDVSALSILNGLLLVGTFDRGLFAVDGSRVAPIGERTLNPYINALAVDSARQILWVGTARGLYRCSGPHPIVCSRASGAESVHALLVLPHGDVLVGSNDGLMLVGSQGGMKHLFGAKAGAPYRAVWALALDQEDHLYIGATNGLYHGRLADIVATQAPALRRAAVVTGELPDDWITALAVSGSTVFVGTYNAGAVALRRSGARLVREHADRSLGYVNPDGIRVLPSGKLAVATMDGLHVGELGSFTIVPTLGQDVTATLLESESKGWVASRRGVSRFEP
jgi:hypothetical protein